MLLHNFVLMFLTVFLLLPGCLSQSVDDEVDGVGVEGSGHSWNPDDESDTVEGSGSNAGISHKVEVHENRTHAKTTQEITHLVKHPDNNSSTNKNAAEKVGSNLVSSKNSSASVGGSVTPINAVNTADTNNRRQYAKSTVSRSTWILILTAAVVACVLIAVAVFIVTKRSGKSKRDNDGYTAGSRVPR